MKILHTADWHLGNFDGPQENGINLRATGVIKCVEHLVAIAEKEIPDFILISGDIFDKAKVWSDRSNREDRVIIKIIKRLKAIAPTVILRGTPNHDDGEAFELLKEFFEDDINVHIITEPTLLHLASKKGKHLQVAGMPGFERGYFRSQHPGLAKTEENEVFTHALTDIVMGLKAQCDNSCPTVLMSHYTVPGCCTESGQVQFYNQSEPVLLQEALNAAMFDLVALGHIHRPQKLEGVHNAFYCGAIDALTFNDEGQERGFWMHEMAADSSGYYLVDSKFYETPYQEFITLNFDNEDITRIVTGELESIAMERWRMNASIHNKIVRVLYECTLENNKALNKAQIEKTLYEDGAFYVKEVQMINPIELVDRTDFSEKTDPETNLREYLENKEYSEEQVGRIIPYARPIIDETLANSIISKVAGILVPVSIEVKNYRNYIDEQFDFTDISFCTINGPNGAGKSSLFMDAIIDCLYEEPREGSLTGWISNVPEAKSGSIIFTFKIGEKIFRVSRSRTKAKSSRITLAIAEYSNGEWVDLSKEKSIDTQTEITNILGMDSLTFKSCALIMQDQYGLFLQADKADKMGILGNMLGLSIYNDMEEISKDKKKEYGAVVAKKKESIAIHEANILKSGDPERELKEQQLILENVQESLNSNKLLRDKVNLSYSSKLDAKRRADVIKNELYSLDVKKSEITNKKADSDQTIQLAESFLNNENEIVSQVEKYNTFVEEEKQLLGEVSLYNAKVLEFNSIQIEQSNTQSELDSLGDSLKSLNEKMAALEQPMDEALIRQKVTEYEEKQVELTELYKLSQKYSAINQSILAKKSEYDLEANTYRSGLLQHENKVKDLERRTELLQNSGCSDISNAECRFLSDARAAEKELESYPDIIVVYKTSGEKKLSDLQVSMNELEEQKVTLNYNPDAISVVTEECSKLKGYVIELEKLNKRESQIALISARMNDVNTNIKTTQKRLDMVKLKAQTIETDKNRYQDSFTRHQQVIKEVEVLKKWVDIEKRIPVEKEKLTTAKHRITELNVELAKIEIDIIDKQQELLLEKEGMTGIESVKSELDRLEESIKYTEHQISTIQVKIGGLQQKIDDNNEHVKSIRRLQDEVNDLTKIEAIYETLKNAFSQDGIPHQITRSILPQLTATANNILGQMTGGKMGMEFVTEKIQTNKKEVVALDILIEEYGKSSLPYLSKSGGEKVKASLSAILALSEIKATSIGVQLGMLFIDEPPFLDGDGIQAYVDALEIIQKRYPNIKIMAITHDPTMKARFPQSLEVVKTESGSKVIFE